LRADARHGVDASKLNQGPGCITCSINLMP
jgi:hypothetical protein